MMAGIVGCGLFPLPASPPPETPPGKWRETEEMVEILVQRMDQFRSLRALASVYYSGTDGSGGFQEVVLVQRPQRVRLETLSPLGVVLLVTADGDEISGFHPREGLFFRGRSSKQNLLRYTQIPLELGELTSLLMGLPPFEARGLWEGNGSSIMRELGGGWKETISFHSTLEIPTDWRRTDPEGKVELKAQFADFSSSAGYFPLKIFLEAPPQQKRLQIRYDEPDLNIELAPGLFVQEKPENAKEVPLESLGG